MPDEKTPVTPSLKKSIVQLPDGQLVEEDLHRSTERLVRGLVDALNDPRSHLHLDPQLLEEIRTSWDEELTRQAAREALNEPPANRVLSFWKKLGALDSKKLNALEKKYPHLVQQVRRKQPHLQRRRHVPKLSGLGLMAKRHWKEHLPSVYRELEKSGELDQILYQAQERTGRAMASLIRQGVPPEQAWELVREEWLLLPPESLDLPPLEEEEEETILSPPMTESGREAPGKSTAPTLPPSKTSGRGS